MPSLFFALLILVSSSAQAHHSMLLYDTQKLVGVKGVVLENAFGNPHTRITVSVQDENGKATVWTVVAQDPNDAVRFGYYDQLAAVKPGQSIAFVGWPHKRNSNEMLGHRMQMAGGEIVELIPLSGYIRPALYQAMDKLVISPTLLQEIEPTSTDLPLLDRIQAWIWSTDPIRRAAADVQLNQAKLIGLQEGSAWQYPGLPLYLSCQTANGFSEQIETSDWERLPATEQKTVYEFIEIYNRVLSKHWELARESCGQ